MKKRISNYESFKIFDGDLTKKAFLNKLSNEINYCDNLINNAASTNKKEFTKVSEKDFESLIKINLKSVFLMSQIFAKKMIKNKIS